MDRLFMISLLKKILFFFFGTCFFYFSSAKQPFSVFEKGRGGGGCIAMH